MFPIRLGGGTLGGLQTAVFLLLVRLRLGEPHARDAKGTGDHPTLAIRRKLGILPDTDVEFEVRGNAHREESP